MPARERSVERGSRRGTEVLRRFADEVRAARVALGLTQREVARAVGSSRSQIGRIEHADLRSLGFMLAARVASAVALDLSVRTFPSGPRVRDARHLELLGRLRSRLAPTWRVAFEVPLPIPGDQRAWDAVATLGHLRVGVEAENRLTDVQSLLRRLALKRRDGGVDRVLLVVRGTHGNRAAVREYASPLRDAFPLMPRQALAALSAGRDPGGDALILL